MRIKAFILAARGVWIAARGVWITAALFFVLAGLVTAQNAVLLPEQELEIEDPQQYSEGSEDIDEDDSSDSGENDDINISDDELENILSSTQTNPHAVVEPLIQTRWRQGSPFNSLFPVVNGSRSITGCVNLAWGQLMKYHRYPVRGRGESSRIIAISQGSTLTVPISPVSINANYDWDNMLNSYRSDGRDSTERQRNAAARLVHDFSAARGIYGSSHRNFPKVMTEVFGYDRSIRRINRAFFTDDEWTAIIKQQLDSGLPVFMHGSSPGTVHGFIIDGYDSLGRFHINWGWGGRSDGWYSLNNLNPGNRERSWYNNQHIVINLKPDAGGLPAPYELAFRRFTAAKTTLLRYETFNVNYSLGNIGSLPFAGELSAVLVDSSGNIAATIGRRASTSVSAGGSRTSFVTCSIPSTLTPGLYRLQIFTRAPNEEIKFVTRSAVSEGIPTAINITVGAGELGGYGLRFSSFTAGKTTVSRNESFNVNYNIRNPGRESIEGSLRAVLIDNAGNETVIGTRSSTSFGAGAGRSSYVTCSIPNTMVPGNYQLKIAVRHTGGEWRIITMSNEGIPNSINITVDAGELSGYGLRFSSFTADKTTASRNESFRVNYNIRNPGRESFEGSLRAVLVNNAGNEIVIGTRSSTSFAAGSGRSSYVSCTIPSTIAPGNYQLRIAVRPTGGEWRIITMSNDNIPNSIGFTVR